MGFITSGQTNDMVVYFTPKGMEYLMGKKTSANDLSVRYFSLGDTDTNYLIDNKSGKGFIPDLSGEDTTCLKTTNTLINNQKLYEQWVSNGSRGIPTSFHKSPIKK